VRGAFGRWHRALRRRVLEPVLVGHGSFRETALNAFAKRGHLVYCRSSPIKKNATKWVSNLERRRRQDGLSVDGVKMAALYSVQYAGKTGVGVGAMYFGDGIIAGFDMYGGRYKGKYTESGGRIKGTVALSMPDGGELVTGQQVPAGTSINIQADWPADLGNGRALHLTVSGQAVAVTFNKMQDIP